MVYLCSFIRCTDGLFGRLFLIAFFLFLGLVPFFDPESLHVPFWMLPAVSAFVIIYSLTSQRLYYRTESEEVCAQNFCLGIPVWPHRTIRLKDVCGLVLKSEHDEEKWLDFFVELHYQELLGGKLGEVKSILSMIRRGLAGAVIEEARQVAKELGVKLHDQRSKATARRSAVPQAYSIDDCF